MNSLACLPQAGKRGAPFGFPFMVSLIKVLEHIVSELFL